MTTLAQALTAADNAVQARYGSGHSGITRTAVEAVLALSEGTVSAPAPVTKSGWAGIRGDKPAEPCASPLMVCQLAQEILAVFKPRANGGWNAYANDKTMTNWREQAGGPE